MFARQHDAAIYSANTVVILRAARIGPASRAAQGPGYAVPGDAYAAFELFRILRMDFGALFQRRLDLVLGREGGKIESRRTVAKNIAAQQHATTRPVIIVRGIADVGNGLVGISDAAINVVIFFPKAALEFQS